MKIKLLALSLCFTSACDGGKSQPEAASGDTAKETKPASDEPAAGDDAAKTGDTKAQPAAAAVEVKPPCEVFDKALVGGTFGWDDLTEGQPNQMDEGRVQGCSFNRTGGVGGSFAVTITKGDARTIERKYIERAFARDLENKDDRVKFEEVQPVIGDQTVFSVGKRGPSNLYQLRWRIGNQVDYLMAVRSGPEIEPAQAQAKLRELAAKL